MTTANSDIHKLLHALNFAAMKHNDQRRKDRDQSPYINHPIGVAEILSRFGENDIIMLQAAVLHDILEDTETTAEELESVFGKEITGIVQEVSDDKSLEKQERKRLQVEHAPFISTKAKLIKLADKIMNVTDVGQNPPSTWDTKRREEYFDWADSVVSGLRGHNRDMENLYDTRVSEGRKRLANENSIR